MKNRHAQAGLSMLGMLFVLLVIGFTATVAIKLIPVYIEASTIRSSIQSPIDKGEFANLTPGGIRSRIGKSFDINMVEGLNIKDVRVKQNKGKTTIDATYERRLPLMYNIDVVVKFDDLIFENVTAKK